MSKTDDSTVTGVYSETGKLKKVLLHRPGDEMKILDQDIRDALLFKDVPSLTGLKQEHDAFARTLEKEGCRVYYYRDLLLDVLTNPVVNQAAIELLCASISDGTDMKRLYERLQGMEPELLCDKLICGLEDGSNRNGNHYHVSPLPNLYFTRDIGLVVGGGILLANMSTSARQREPGLLKLLYRHHPIFGKIREKLWYDGEAEGGNLECGDVLVLSPETLAVGASIRSRRKALETLARRLFSQDSGFRRILAVEMPHEKEFFHLDTILTMADRNKFLYYPVVHDDLKFFTLEPGGKDDLKVQEEYSLEKALEKALGFSGIELINCFPLQGGELTRTRSNESANSLAVAPGRILLYSSSGINAEPLEKSGIEIIGIEGSQLMRGRGGPHCMSMPLEREN